VIASSECGGKFYITSELVAENHGEAQSQFNAQDINAI